MLTTKLTFLPHIGQSLLPQLKSQTNMCEGGVLCLRSLALRGGMARTEAKHCKPCVLIELYGTLHRFWILGVLPKKNTAESKINTLEWVNSSFLQELKEQAFPYLVFSQ